MGWSWDNHTSRRKFWERRLVLEVRVQRSTASGGIGSVLLANSDDLSAISSPGSSSWTRRGKSSQEDPRRGLIKINANFTINNLPRLRKNGEDETTTLCLILNITIVESWWDSNDLYVFVFDALTQWKASQNHEEDQPVKLHLNFLGFVTFLLADQQQNIMAADYENGLDMELYEVQMG